MSKTKTPDPPANIPEECADDYGRADCYRKGFEDGYGKGYNRAIKDCNAADPGRRKKDSKPKKARVECKGGDKEECYRKGYEDGYAQGYASGLVDCGEA